MAANNLIPIVLAMFCAYALGSMAYVYRFRGTVRYDGFSEYLRKGWFIFTPLNCFLYLLTEERAKRPIMDLSRFKELDLLKENWETIRDEVIALHKRGVFEESKNPDTNSYYDIGFRTFYKYGWSKFYVKWYGYSHKSAKELCPKTVELLDQIKCVNGAMFSILPVGSKLTRHLDPFACSLRYHLGLSTPNSDDCWIEIDGQTYSWRDGEALLFDETYVHHARNDAKRDRLILMCDVDRPLHFGGRAFNRFVCFLMRFSIVPNREGDKRGIANKIFATLAPLLARSKALKERNRPLYLLLKWSVNTILLIIVLGLLAALLYGIYALVQALGVPVGASA